MANLQEIASFLGLEAVNIPPLEISGLQSLRNASPNELGAYFAPRYLKDLEKTRAGAVILPMNIPVPDEVIALRVENPGIALCDIQERFFPEFAETWGAKDPSLIHPTTVIGNGVVCGPESRLGPYVVIGEGVRIGAACRIGPHVTIERGSVIGDRVIIQSHTVIGNSGFGYLPVSGGTRKVPQLGRVVIDDDVHIGASCTVNRGTFGDTRIGAGTRLDDFVHIAHNATLGRGVLVAAYTGIAGSAVLEDGVVCGGMVGVLEHARIGRGARLGARSGVTHDLPPSADYAGHPARPLNQHLRDLAAGRRVADRLKAIAGLERRIALLEKRLGKVDDEMG